LSSLKQIKKLAGESAVYGVAGVFFKFISLFLFPFYSRILSPAEYGSIGMYNSSFFFIAILVCFAMDSATFRFFYDHQNSVVWWRKIFSTWFFFQFALGVFFFILIFCFGNHGFAIIDNQKSSFAIFKWMAVLLLLYGTPTLLEVWYRLHRKPVAAITFSISTTLLNICVTVFCILKLRLGIMGFIYGQFSGYLAGTFFGLIYLRKWIKPIYFDFSLLKKMLKYATPLLPAGMAATGLVFASNYFLKSKLNFAELGLYSIGNTLASALGLITMAFGQAWSPFAFSIANTATAKKTYSLVLTIYCIILSFICLCFSIFLPDILRLLTNKNYYDAEIVSCILCFNIFFVSTSVIGMTGNGIAKKSTPYAKAVLFGGLISLILLTLLGSYFGKEGAALGLLLGQLAIPFYVFKSSQKVYYIPFLFNKISITILLSVALVITDKIYFSYSTFLVSFLYKLAILFIFIICNLFLFRNEINSFYINYKLLKFKKISNKEIDQYESIVDSKAEIQ